MNATTATGTTTTPPPTSDEAQSEVRFAVVMYGGVSLAIYIHGVTQELLHLVRSTARRGPGGTGAALFGKEKLAYSERVYRRLSHALAAKKPGIKILHAIKLQHQSSSSEGAAPAAAAKLDQLEDAGPVRFVVDILTGTSAGGINGAYLAKALANQQSLDDLQRLWRSQGEIATLLNDQKSLTEMPRGLRIDPQPASLLNSQRMYLMLLDVLRRMETERPSREGDETPLVEQLDLYVTTTDIRGLALPIQLADQSIWERRFRNVFHFRYAAATTACGPRNDFLKANDPFLAFAARATSSFPFAFEPARLEDVEDLLKKLPSTEKPDLSEPTLQQWRKFYSDYLDPVDNLGFGQRSFGDGGYLDNKPFSYATESLLHRRADRPVSRKLIYIEPSPEHPELDPTPTDKINAIENIQRALDLPRQETIREDIQRVRDRNRFLQRVGRITDGLNHDIARAKKVKSQTTLPANVKWDQLGLAEMVEIYGISYVAYHRLKIADATDDLTGFVAGLSGIEEDSDRFVKLREMVKRWREAQYVLDHDKTAADKPTQNKFLLDFNYRYRPRRMRFVMRKISELADAANPTVRGEILKQAGVEFESTPAIEQEFQYELRQVRRKLNDIICELERAIAPLHHRPTANDPRAIAPHESLAQSVRKLDLDSQLEKLFTSEDPRPMQAKLDEVCQTCDAALNAVALGVKQWLVGPCRDAWNKCSAAWADDPSLPEAVRAVRACLKFYFEHFDDYDLFLYPLLYGSDGEETDVVAISRVSPEDATSLFDARKLGCGKLGGDSFGHFGGFLDPLWRDNDILWGRLDGAERLVRAIATDSGLDEDDVTRFILEAQAAIVAEEIQHRGSNETDRLLVEVFMRPRNKQPADRAVQQFLSNLSLGAKTDPDVKELLDPIFDERRLLEVYHRAFANDRKPEPQQLLQSSARATVIVGKMLDGLADNYGGHGKALAKKLTLIGRAFWGLVELAVPRSPLNFSVVHWLGLFYFAGLVVLLGGIMLGQQQVITYGGSILLLTLGAQLFIGLFNRLMRRLPVPSLRLLRNAAIVLAVALLAAVLLLARLELPHAIEDLRKLFSQFLQTEQSR